MLVYLGAPLFSVAERAFNAEVTSALESAGMQVFLPQRDGAEALVDSLQRHAGR